MKNKLPAIVSKVAPDVRRFFDRVREILESPDEFVTEEDLIDTGAFRRGSTTGLDFIDPIVTSTSTSTGISCSTPPIPTSLTANGAFTNIMLEWDAGGYTVYGSETDICYAYAEVWRADSDDQGVALLLGTTQAELYSDPVGEGVTKYYWVRLVNTDGVAGDYNALGGVKGETAPDIPYLLTQLTNQISTSELATALNTTIENNTSEITTAKDNYSVKINNAGQVSGFGLLSTTAGTAPTSDFGVKADTFWIAPPAHTSTSAPSNPYEGMVWVDTSDSENHVTKYYTGTEWGTTAVKAIPFTVKTSPTYEVDAQGQPTSNIAIPAGVYMDAAYIQNASITMAKIKDLTVDSAHIVEGSIDTGHFGTIEVTSAQITGLDVSKLTSTGATITSAFINTAEITNLVVTNLANLDQATIAGGILTSVELPVVNNTPVPLVDDDGNPYVKITNLRIDAAKVDGNLSSSTSVADGGWELNDTGVSYFGGVLDAALIKTNSRMSDDVYGYSMPLRTLVTGEMATNTWGNSWHWDLIGAGGMPSTSYPPNDPPGWAYSQYTNIAVDPPPGFYRPAGALDAVVQTPAYDEKTISGLPESKWVGTSTWLPEDNRIRSRNCTIRVRFINAESSGVWEQVWGTDHYIRPMVRFVGAAPSGSHEPIVGGLWETYKLQWMDFPDEIAYKVGGSIELNGGWVPPSNGTLPGNIVLQFGLTNRKAYNAVEHYGGDLRDVPNYNNPDGVFFNRTWSGGPKVLGGTGVPEFVMEIESYNI